MMAEQPDDALTLRTAIPRVTWFAPGRAAITMAVLALVLIGSLVLAACVGAAPSTPGEVASALAAMLGLGIAGPEAQVLIHLRFPRVALALLVGGVLGITGAAAQGLFRNPLAEPGLIGIPTGAALAVMVVTVLGGVPALSLVAQLPLPIAAFIGAMIAALTVKGLAGLRGGAASTTLILAGVAINALCGALMGILFFLANDNQIRTITFWTMGSLGAASWAALAGVAVPMLLSLVLLATRSRALNILQLGDDEAGHVGLNVAHEKSLILGLVALGVGAAVSLTGVIGFVGLVVPHLVRLTLGPNHRALLPASALAGGILIVLADAASRTLVAPAELPIGALTAVLGAPFFLWLLMRPQGGER